jgi:hypothetical protein
MSAKSHRSSRLATADPPALPDVVDRTAFQAELDVIRVRERRTPVRATRSLPLVDGCRWLRSTPPPGLSVRMVRSLLDVFEGRRQLIYYYFMWYPGKPAVEQCEGCTLYNGQVRELSYLHSRDVTYATRCYGPYRRMCATATSWAGRCRGIPCRTRLSGSWPDGSSIGLCSSAISATTPGCSRHTGPPDAA